MFGQAFHVICKWAAVSHYSSYLISKEASADIPITDNHRQNHCIQFGSICNFPECTKKTWESPRPGVTRSWARHLWRTYHDDPWQRKDMFINFPRESMGLRGIPWVHGQRDEVLPASLGALCCFCLGWSCRKHSKRTMDYDRVVRIMFLESMCGDWWSQGSLEHRIIAALGHPTRSLDENTAFI